MESTEDTYNSPEEKMKRMAVAVKGVGGWFSYFMGMATLIVGTINIYQIYKFVDYFISFLGVSITLTGLYLLTMHVLAKKFQGKVRIVKLIKLFGGIFVIPGLLGIMTLNQDSSIYNFFAILTGIGAGLIFTSFILKKAWGIKTEKRKRINTPV